MGKATISSKAITSLHQINVKQFKNKIMIKANELRIGNLVHRNDYPNDVYRLRSISDDRVHAINTVEMDGNNPMYASDCTLSELEPIPLTPELLEKCGFVMLSLHEYALPGNHFFSVQIMGGWTDKILSPGARYRIYKGAAGAICNIEYLHQLQNGFYFLTGAELTLSL